MSSFGAAPQMMQREMQQAYGGGGGGGGFGAANGSGGRPGRGGSRMRKMSKSKGARPPAPQASAGAPPPPASSRMQFATGAARKSSAAGESKSSGGQTSTTTTTTTTMQTVQSKEGSSSSSSASDWTNIPKRMDETFEKLDTDSALRPTIMKVDTVWQRTTQKGLLSRPVCDKTFNIDKQKTEKQKTFDLLDALTRSGVMAFETGASLHVVLCATHCFDKGIMNTLVQNNINPIEKVERSSLIMASTIHRIPPIEMIKP